MQVKNIKRVTETEITCEIKHPKYGWIPYTAMANSGEEDMEKIWQKCNTEDLEYDTEILRNRYRSDIIAKMDYGVFALISQYTDREQSLFDTKVIEAEKVLAGGKSTLLETEANIKKITVKKLAENIKSKSDKYREMIVKVEASKPIVYEAFQNLTSLEEINATRDKYMKLALEITNAE